MIAGINSSNVLVKDWAPSCPEGTLLFRGREISLKEGRTIDESTTLGGRISLETTTLKISQKKSIRMSQNKPMLKYVLHKI